MNRHSRRKFFGPGSWLRPAIVLGMVAVSGCGSGEPFELIPVSGKVTYDDGSLIPAQRLVVTFIPQVKAVDAKTHPRPGQTDVNVADGTFSYMTTHKAADGATAGPNKVLVVAYDDRENPTGAVPSIYASPETTPLAVDVSSSSREFQLQVKKK